MDVRHRKNEIEKMLSEILTDCPEDPYLRMRADQVIHLQEKLHKEEGDLLELTEEFQAKCPHETMLEVRKFYSDYRARIDGIHGLNALHGHKCSRCKIFKPKKNGPPSEVCYKCGGDMQYVGRAQYGMDDVRIHRCAACGHEYEII